MRILGFMMLGVGLVVLVYGGFRYSRQKTIVEIGPLKATATEQKSFPLPPIAGGIVMISGILLLAVPQRRTKVA